MQFESLKVFCDVVRHRSFSRAALENHVSQSAASQVVSHLEKRLKAQLIDRSKRPLQLTPAGKLYYDGCKPLVEQYLRLEASVQSAQATAMNTVRVAAIYSVGLRHMSRVVESFTQQFPRAKVTVDYLHPDRVYGNVLDGSSDLGLVSFPRKVRELVAVPWREEEMVLACAPQHRLAGSATARLSAINRERYVAFDKGLVIRRMVDRFLREHGVAVDVVLEFDNIENIKKAVAISAGVALLPRPTLEPELAEGALAAVTLQDCEFARAMAIVHRRLEPGSMAQSFIQFLLQSDPLARPSGMARVAAG